MLYTVWESCGHSYIFGNHLPCPLWNPRNPAMARVSRKFSPRVSRKPSHGFHGKSFHGFHGKFFHESHGNGPTSVTETFPRVSRKPAHGWTQMSYTFPHPHLAIHKRLLLNSFKFLITILASPIPKCIIF
jgi:hypothetical protein